MPCEEVGNPAAILELRTSKYNPYNVLRKSIPDILIHSVPVTNIRYGGVYCIQETPRLLYNISDISLPTSYVPVPYLNMQVTLSYLNSVVVIVVIQYMF
jgi:hypothetical protein